MSQRVRITVLVENTAQGEGLLAEHGLAYWIEYGDKRVLFDTGQGAVLDHNAAKLNIPLDQADAIVLSHGHYDHTGGLGRMLRKTHCPLYLHPAALEKKYSCPPRGPVREIGMPAAVQAAAMRVEHVDFEAAAAKESRWRRFLYCMQTPRDLSESVGVLAVLIAVAVVCQMMIPNWGSAANRLMQPWEFVPSVGSVQIVSVTPGSTEVLLGSSLEIAAEVRNPQNKPLKATLFVMADQEQEVAMPMTAENEHRFKLSLPSVLKPLSYRLDIGDSQSDIYQVGIREKPTLAEVKVTYRYPAYLTASPTPSRRDWPTWKPRSTPGRHQRFTSAISQPSSMRPEYAGHVEQNASIGKMPLPKTASTRSTCSTTRATPTRNRVNRIRLSPDRAPTAGLSRQSRRPRRQRSGGIRARRPRLGRFAKCIKSRRKKKNPPTTAQNLAADAGCCVRPSR